MRQQYSVRDEPCRLQHLDSPQRQTRINISRLSPRTHAFMTPWLADKSVRPTRYLVLLAEDPVFHDKRPIQPLSLATNRCTLLSPASICGPVAQLDRASVFGTEGWGFDSLRGRQSIP